MENRLLRLLQIAPGERPSPFIAAHKLALFKHQHFEVIGKIRFGEQLHVLFAADFLSSRINDKSLLVELLKFICFGKAELDERFLAFFKRRGGSYSPTTIQLVLQDLNVLRRKRKKRR